MLRRLSCQDSIIPLPLQHSQYYSSLILALHNQTYSRCRATRLSASQHCRNYNTASYSKKNDVTAQRRTPRFIKNDMRDLLRTKTPNDFGLLPSTLIMPTGANRPSFTSAPILVLKMEAKRIKQRLSDFMSILVYKWSMKPRINLQLRKIAPTATALYSQMYTAFAEGDRQTIHSITCSNLEKELFLRMSARDAREKYHWTLQKYVSKPRVVSHRAGQLPKEVDGGDASPFLRQAVVRIRSVQSVQSVLQLASTLQDRSSKTTAGGLNEEDVEITEYIVLQKFAFNGVEEEDWSIWGFAEETIDIGEETEEHKVLNRA